MFHLSIPVSNLERARAFYVDLLGCRVGRESAKRMDIDFFGHHVVAHRSAREAGRAGQTFHSDGVDVSVRHFGVILEAADWESMRRRLEAKNAIFSMPPQTIREGSIDEQRIMMLPDGCGNIVELKSIDRERVFAR